MSYPKLTPIIAKGATEPRYLEDRFADVINVKDFGAVGDGETDDTSAFESLESVVSGKAIDLCGYSYNVSEIPTGNFYYNGAFISGGRTIKAYGSNIFAYWMPNALLGWGVGNADVNFFISNGVITPEDIEAARAYSAPHLKDVILIGNRAGYGATKNGTYLSDCIALGSGTMSYGNMTSAAEHNIAIGQFSLHRVTSGDRNIGIGPLSLVGLTSGRCNVAIGRDCCQGITTGSYNTAIGYCAMGEYGWADFDEEIDGQTRITGSENVALGYQAGFRLAGDSTQNIYIGGKSGIENKKVNSNVIIGRSAFAMGQLNTSLNGKTVIKETLNGTYSHSANAVNISMSGHHAVVGCYVILTFTSATDPVVNNTSRICYVTSVSDSSFTVSSPVEKTDSGTCVSSIFEQSADSSELVNCCCTLGNLACAYQNSGNLSVAIGFHALQGVEGENNITRTTVAIGGSACEKVKDSERSNVIGYAATQNTPLLKFAVAVGDYAGQAADTKIESSVLIGSNAGRWNTNTHSGNILIGSNAGSRKGNLTNCVCIGINSMYHETDTTDFTNAIAIGASTQVTGNNQCQLGNSNVTTYVYGSVQDRSDERDKTDIRDTTLGLDFIRSLRPVDFKWDYRDDYFDYVEKEVEVVDKDGVVTTETVIEAIPVEKDGSRKRNRYHHGLIAQEVKAILDANGIDFGGYQDHKINGGKDVLTLGYEEFIAPLIKSVQELSNKVEQLEERIRQLTNSNN